MRTHLTLPLLLALTSLCAACGGPTYVTDEEEPRLDSYTMRLRFARKDLDSLYAENIAKLLASPMGNPPVVAIFPMRNETSEHIGPQLDALLSKFETDLVNKSPVDVIDYASQPQLLAEINQQQSSAYNL